MILHSQAITPPDNLEVLEDFSPLKSKASSFVTGLERNLKGALWTFLVLTSGVCHRNT